MRAVKKGKESDSTREYYENGSNQVAEVTAVQLKKLEQVCTSLIMQDNVWIF